MIMSDFWNAELLQGFDASLPSSDEGKFGLAAQRRGLVLTRNTMHCDSRASPAMGDDGQTS